MNPSVTVVGSALFTTTPLGTVLEKIDPATGSVIEQIADSTIDQFCALASDGTSLYTLDHAGNGARVDKRSPSDGSIIWSVNTGDLSCGSSTSSVHGRIRVSSAGVFVAGAQLVRLSRSDGSQKWGGISIDYAGHAVLDLAADDTGVYTAGSGTPPSSSNDVWEVIRYDVTDGSVVWDQRFNSSATSDSATAIAVSSAGLFVGGYETTYVSLNISVAWHVVRLDPTTGSSIWNQQGATNPNETEPYGAVAVVNSVYVVGDYTGLRLEKRNAADGSL